MRAGFFPSAFCTYGALARQMCGMLHFDLRFQCFIRERTRLFLVPWLTYGPGRRVMCCCRARCCHAVRYTFVHNCFTSNHYARCNRLLYLVSLLNSIRELKRMWQCCTRRYKGVRLSDVKTSPDLFDFVFSSHGRSSALPNYVDACLAHILPLTVSTVGSDHRTQAMCIIFGPLFLALSLHLGLLADSVAMCLVNCTLDGRLSENGHCCRQTAFWGEQRIVAPHCSLCGL